MKGRHEFNIKEAAFYVFQMRAYSKLVERVLQGSNAVSIVLPPRCGKTDTMRVGGLRLIRDKLVSSALILVPDRILLQQTFDSQKLSECLERYEIDYFPRTYAVDGQLRSQPLLNADLAGMTIQLATNRLPELTNWVAAMKRIHGVPPIIFTDECHTLSVENRWGETLQTLQKAGAIISLFTATPYRTDRQLIPGFRPIPITDPEDVRFYLPVGDELMGEFAATRQVLKMEPDHYTGFREVWDVPDIPILCKIGRRSFDLPLNDEDEATEDILGTTLLSEVTDERRIRRVLRTELRQPHIIEKAVRIFIDEMARRREAKGTESTAGIIFVGSNDESISSVDSQHAYDVQSILNRLSGGHLRVAIATSDEDDAIETINSFTAGDLDVLIVKQMAGRGLDVPRLKVELDLSSVRTANAFVQRVTRICTMWRYGDGKDDFSRAGTYICPDDFLTISLFNQFVADEHGEIAVERSDAELLRTFTPTPREPDQATVYRATDVVLPKTLGDSDLIQVPGDRIPLADYMFANIEGLANLATQARFIATLEGAIGEGYITLPGAPERETVTDDNVVTEPPNPVKPFHDLGAEWQEARDRVEALHKEVAKVLYAEEHGELRIHYDPKKYANIVRKLWTHHYKRIGKPAGTKVNSLALWELQEIEQNLTDQRRAMSHRIGHQGRLG